MKGLVLSGLPKMVHICVRLRDLAVPRMGRQKQGPLRQSTLLDLSASGTLRPVEFRVFDQKVVFDLFEPDRRVGRALLADRERHLDATHFLIVVVMQRSASKIFLNQPDLPRDEYGGHAGRTFRHALRGCVGR